MRDAKTVITDFLEGVIFSSKPQELNTEDLLAELAKAGFVLVPEVPTLKMCRAGEAVPDMRLTSHVWKAMVEAAR